MPQRSLEESVEERIRVTERLSLYGNTYQDLIKTITAFADKLGMAVDDVCFEWNRGRDGSENYMVGSRPPTEKEKRHRRAAYERRQEQDNAAAEALEERERAMLIRLREKYPDA